LLSQIPIPTLTAPTPRISHHLARFSLNEILRYRYHHGPNTGSTFVLENSCTARHTMPMLQEAVSSMPLSRKILPTLACTETFASGLSHAASMALTQKWEAHWSSALSDDELHWLFGKRSLYLHHTSSQLFHSWARLLHQHSIRHTTRRSLWQHLGSSREACCSVLCTWHRSPP
jgi:hypothetical protein